MDTNKAARRVADFVAPQLEPGEQVEAILRASQTGPSPWLWSLLLGPLLGVLYGIRHYAVTVTDRRVLFVRLGGWVGGPKAVEEAYPRTAVKVKDFKPGTVYGVLRLTRPSGELKLNFHRVARGGAEDVVRALGAAAA